MDISPQSLGRFLHRYHTILFAVFVLGGLIAMVLMLNNIIVSSGESAAPLSTAPAGGFDQQTIDKLNSLRASGQPPTPLDLSGRSNPFVE